MCSSCAVCQCVGKSSDIIVEGMPWNWQGRGEESTDQGGSRGSYEEAKVAHAWPKYEAEYLAKRLSHAAGKYNPDGPIGPATKEVAQHVYFEKISEDYKQEADECLKSEFTQWLQGNHADNTQRSVYKNEPGKPVRRGVFRSEAQKPSEPMRESWRPTWWGKTQLTHLPGVREYLFQQREHQNEADFRMNMLAEAGPQDLEQAWVYFKHWVKGRPVAPEVCMSLPKGAPGEIGDGRIIPASMKSWRAQVQDRDRTGPLLRGRFFGGGTTGGAAFSNAASDSAQFGASMDAEDTGNPEQTLAEELQEMQNELSNTIKSQQERIKQLESAATSAPPDASAELEAELGELRSSLASEKEARDGDRVAAAKRGEEFRVQIEAQYNQLSEQASIAINELDAQLGIETQNRLAVEARLENNNNAARAQFEGLSLELGVARQQVGVLQTETVRAAASHAEEVKQMAQHAQEEMLAKARLAQEEMLATHKLYQQAGVEQQAILEQKFASALMAQKEQADRRINDFMLLQQQLRQDEQYAMANSIEEWKQSTETWKAMNLEEVNSFYQAAMHALKEANDVIKNTVKPTSQAELDALVNDHLNALLKGAKAAADSGGRLVISAGGESDPVVKKGELDIAAKLKPAEDAYLSHMKKLYDAKTKNAPATVILDLLKDNVDLVTKGDDVGFTTTNAMSTLMAIKERVKTRRKGRRGAFGHTEKRQATIKRKVEDDEAPDDDATLAYGGSDDDDATIIGDITPPTDAAFADVEIVGEVRKPKPGSQARVNFDIGEAQGRGDFVDLGD